ncbi:MAG: MFS transporter [Granulosicoccus sp.]|nr:MFS transporter [Granulosicoccus sp.]
MAPFSNPVFRSLWLATLVSNLGGLVQAVAAGWTMTTLTDSEHMVALVTASTSLPIMTLALLAGVLADNYDRRRIMLVAQILMLVVSTALAVTAYLDLLTPWLLLSFTFLIGCGGALHNPSWQASVGDIVPRDQVPAAVMANGMSFNLMRSIGPALGGIIIVIAGAAAAFALNAVSYLALIIALAMWRTPGIVRTLPRERFRQATTAGIRYVSLSPNLLRIILRGFLFGLTGVAVLALLPLIARDLLGGGASTYGFLLGLFGLGAVGGALTNSRTRAAFNNETIVRTAFVGMALGVLLLALGDTLLLAAFALLLCGACWVTTNALLNVSLQLSTPRWVVGRALSFYMTANACGMVAGSWLWGLTAETHGLQNALMLSAVTLIAGAVIGLRLPMPEFDKLNLDPLNRFIEPALALQLTPRTGPIMVTVDFNIAEPDIPAFLEAMAARRRIRIRDGARRWSLLRDLEQPDIWTEKYYVATWIEYIRHNQRRTMSDSGISEALHALHRGAHPPRVRRMIERQTVPKQPDPPIKGYDETH